MLHVFVARFTVPLGMIVMAHELEMEKNSERNCGHMEIRDRRVEKHYGLL